MKKLNQTEIEKMRALGYDLPAKNYWIKGDRVMRTKDLLEQLGYAWATKDQNELHEFDIILREKELDWSNATIITQLTKKEVL